MEHEHDARLPQEHLASVVGGLFLCYIERIEDRGYESGALRSVESGNGQTEDAVNMSERMIAYTDREDFINWNCLRCKFYELPESSRPCKESIPFLFNSRMWYPDYCPYTDPRPLTDKEREELDQMIDSIAGERGKLF